MFRENRVGASSTVHRELRGTSLEIDVCSLPRMATKTQVPGRSGTSGQPCQASPKPLDPHFPGREADTQGKVCYEKERVVILTPNMHWLGRRKRLYDL